MTIRLVSSLYLFVHRCLKQKHAYQKLQTRFLYKNLKPLGFSPKHLAIQIQPAFL